MSIFDQQLGELQAKYQDTEAKARPDGSRFIQLEIILPTGWSKPKTRVYFVAPVGYPHAKPDCFWAENDLRLASGGQPANASANHNGHGEPTQLLWFSYHASAWNPNKDSLMTYVRVIEQRLKDLR